MIIKRWDTGAVLWAGEAATMRDALAAAIAEKTDLSVAALSGATLSRATLSRADLSRANLSGANLSRADLSWANLSGADLSWANLSRAIGVSPERSTPLFMLYDQPGAIRAYKLVNADGVGPFNGGITYRIGESYEVNDANTDATEQCAAGINVATLDWCLSNWQAGYRVLIVEFEANDIAAIPTATDGKFRCHRVKVIGEKDIAALVAAPEKALA